jgi:hypothetical protein
VPKSQCPNCKIESEVPDQFIGRHVTCKKCKQDFVVSAPKAPSRTTAIAQAPAASAPTVVAHPMSAGGGGLRLAVWGLAAAIAFLLPVVAAGGFVAWKWKGKSAAPPAPEVYAAIEVGSSGVTYTVFEFSKRPGQDFDSYEIVVFESKPTEITKGMGKTLALDKEGLKKTTEAIRECYQKLKNDDKVAADRIFLVGSGGLMGAIRNRKDLSEAKKKILIEENNGELRRAVKAAVGTPIGFVSPEEEAEHQLHAIVEPNNLDTGMYIDVGTGATRGAYRSPSGRIHKLQVAGVRELADGGKRHPGGVTGKGGKRLIGTLVGTPLRKQVKEQPELRSRRNVYLSGGIVWALSTCLHTKAQVAPIERGAYVELSSQDLKDFAAYVRKDNNYLKSYEPPADLTDEEKTKARAEIKRAQGPFPPDRLLAGTEILAALSEELELEGKTLKFHRYANVAWLMSYIVKQRKKS